MPKLEKSETFEKLLKILIKVVGRRTTREYAVSNIEKIINKLKVKYSFLKYIKIHNSAYSEKEEDVTVEPDINNVDTEDLSKAINEIFDIMIITMGKNVGYFYIREIQDELGKEIGDFFNEFDLDLNLKQQEHILGIMERSVIKIQEVKNSEIFYIVLSGIVRLLNRKISETFTKDLVIDTIKNMQKNYDFLKYLNIDEQLDFRRPYDAVVDPKIDNIVIENRGEILQKLLEEIGKTSDLEVRKFLGEKFERLLGSEDFEKIKGIGLKLENVDKNLRKQGHQLVLSEIFQFILDTVKKKISLEFGLNYIDALVKKLQGQHEILNYIKIDKKRSNEGINAIEIMPEINNFESYELARAIKSMLIHADKDLKELNPNFIKDFEKNMSEQYISDLEEIGVNLNILVLRTS